MLTNAGPFARDEFDGWHRGSLRLDSLYAQLERSCSCCALAHIPIITDGWLLLRAEYSFGNCAVTQQGYYHLNSIFAFKHRLHTNSLFAQHQLSCISVALAVIHIIADDGMTYCPARLCYAQNIRFQLRRNAKTFSHSLYCMLLSLSYSLGALAIVDIITDYPVRASLALLVTDDV